MKKPILIIGLSLLVSQNLFSQDEVASIETTPNEGTVAVKILEKTEDLQKTAKNEWEFLKVKISNANENTYSFLLEDLNRWLLSYPDSEYAEEVLLEKAVLLSKMENYAGSIVVLLRHMYEFPGSKFKLRIASQLSTAINERVDKGDRQSVTDISKEVSKAVTTRARLADFLEIASRHAGVLLYRPLADEFFDFFVRFPNYEKSDRLWVLLADMHYLNANDSVAMLCYEKVEKVYPETQFLARARRSIGDIYAVSFKNYDKAMEIYQGVINSFPQSIEAGYAYQSIAKMAVERKQYQFAIGIYDKIVELYAGTDVALSALKAKAEISLKELDNPQLAIDCYSKISDMFKGEQGISALQTAAEIARKEVKDANLQVKLLEKIAGDYPNTVDAPRMLFEIAEIYERKLFDNKKALNYYKQIVNKYPGDSTANAARRKIKSLEKE
jgi:TolA-binding protein